MRMRRRDRRSGSQVPPQHPGAESSPSVAAGGAAADATDSDALRTIEHVRPYTMTGVPRLTALIDAVRHCIRRDVPGDFAECGVWRGGSVLAMILTLQQLGAEDREVHLYDTFEGMTEPTEHDTSPFHPPALELWESSSGRPWKEFFDGRTNARSAVHETLLQTGYPAELIKLVEGPVERTLPGAAPERLALLRLDTDWYESTLHELRHLYPRLVPGGVLIIDDYGHWEGCRRAVDEYFSTEAAPLLLNRIDYTGRIAVKA